MKKSMLLFGAVLTALPLITPARDFPLQFKTLTAAEAMAFPGGSGAVASLQPDKPAGILKEPPAVSRQPLYGQLPAGTGRLWFRLDESKGDGKGYDRLLVDLNQNGDLTDDPAAERVPSAEPSPATESPEIMLFGPIPAPDNKRIGGGRPVYFAQVYLYRPPARVGALPRGIYLGQLRLKAGWYLATTADMDGVTREVGVVDGNCDLKLGGIIQPTIYRSGAESNWYFPSGDYFLVARGGAANFENSIGTDSSAPFGPVLYLGAKPYKAALAADCKSLTLEPWAGPLAELALQPQGGQVSRIQVAWESAPGRWQLLQPGVENGRAAVPPGNYWLYTCQIKVSASSNETLILNGYKRLPKDITAAEAGVSAPFRCGPPLEIKASSRRDSAVVTTPAPEASSFLGRLLGNAAPSAQAIQQLIQASVIGAGGEMYSSFYLQDKGHLRQPPKPTFAIFTADGKLVESGNMEFG